MKKRNIILITILIALTTLASFTYLNIQPFSEMNVVRSDIQNIQVVDRHNVPLSISYQNRWNSYDVVHLHQIPNLLKQAFILSEDQHFYQHGGIDWKARAGALWNLIRFQRASRGASTLSEQVVRMHHPRPRTLWAKWLETIEVMQLESQFNKAEIFEFYLNQVPYVSNRRGVVQAAHHYFDRDLSTLSVKEMLALVVLARAPSRYDLYKNPDGINGPIMRLAQRMRDANIIDDGTITLLASEKLELSKTQEPVNAAHFVTYVRSQLGDVKRPVIHTTLDATLQARVQGLVDQRVKNLRSKNLHNGAALVLDHQSGEIVAWVVAGAGRDPSVLVVPGDQIDAVTTLRQPGSSLKPFLYALALDLGWNDTTIIDDAPLAQTIGEGYHQFANYSHRFYGKMTLRDALGNSLNIPALKTIQFTGVARYLDKLHALGFASLKQPREFYEEGLALGTGEVTLLELVQAYSALAQRGNYRSASVLAGASTLTTRQVYTEESASLISDILSDAKARQLEFGANSVQNLPVQTAVKTGTSSDYHDAWAVGYNYRYVVGVWMGNLNREPTDGVTGGTGPALTLRSIFGELTKNEKTEPLYVSTKLAARKDAENKDERAESYRVVLPTPGMQVAIDPRVRLDRQKLMMSLNLLKEGDVVEWRVDGALVATTKTKSLAWQLNLGSHKMAVVIKHADNTKTRPSEVDYLVK